MGPCNLVEDQFCSHQLQDLSVEHAGEIALDENQDKNLHTRRIRSSKSPLVVSNRPKMDLAVHNR